MNSIAKGDIDFDRICRRNALKQQTLKEFLLSQVSEVYALLYEVEFSVSGNRSEVILKVLTEIRPICERLEASQVCEYIALLDNVVRHKPENTGFLHHQIRIDNLLNSIRNGLYSYQQRIEREL